METTGFFRDLKLLYEKRRLSGIDAFLAKWVADDCVVSGTALGELMLTYKDVRALFDSDLRYWYDLAVDADSASGEDLGEVTFVSCKAEIRYRIREDEQRYRNYRAWCGSIAAERGASPSVKAAQIAFILDTLLSSRKNKLRMNRLPLTVRALMRDGKAVFLSFAFDRDIDTADHYLGDGGQTATNYREERALLGDCPVPRDLSLCVTQALCARGYEDALFAARGGVFFGTALEPRRDTLNEAMKKALEPLAGEEDVGSGDDVYQSLFDLRLRIAFLEKVYAIGKHPRAVVRFFGLVSGGKVALLIPTYPLGSYMEWH